MESKRNRTCPAFVRVTFDEDVTPGFTVRMKTNFGYQYEKLCQARSALMLPHREGAAQSIAHAFHAISLGLHRFDLSQVREEQAKVWIETIRGFMDAPLGTPSDDRGLWYHRGLAMSEDDQYELSRAVDELASWFRRNSGFEI